MKVALLVRSRQILLVKLLDVDPGEETTGAGTMLNSIPLGTWREVQSLVADSNVAGDDSPDGIGLLYGPGITLQLPMVGPDEPVSQVMVSIEEEEIAWPVLMRMCRRLGWKMLDPESGRTFGG